jgi:hypothetical protein
MFVRHRQGSDRRLGDHLGDVPFLRRPSSRCISALGLEENARVMTDTAA